MASWQAGANPLHPAKGQRRYIITVTRDDGSTDVLDQQFNTLNGAQKRVVEITRRHWQNARRSSIYLGD